MSSVPRQLDNWGGVWAEGSIDIPSIVTDVAGRLGVSEPAAQPYVQAAVDYICDDTGLGSTELPGTDLRLVKSGIPLLAMRMYQDTPNLGGETNQIDPTFTGVYTPARLYSHLDEYWRHLTNNFGVA